MTSFLQLILLVFLAVRFGGCPDPPRMVREFDYQTTQNEAFSTCKEVLSSLQYDIDIFSPESHFMVTKPKRLRKTLRRYDYIVAIYITDRVEVFIAAQRSIFKRGSELSIGGKTLIEKQTEDTIPVSLQKKIFIPIINQLLARGLTPIRSL